MPVMTKDFSIDIVIPGNPAVKKNGMNFSFRYKDRKTGRLLYRDNLLKFPNDTMIDYETLAVPALIVAKTKLESEFGFGFLPISTKVHVRFIFYRKDKRADLSNLYEAPQDLLQGKVEVEKFKILKQRMQIITNDSVIESHDGSRQFVDKSNPRTLITIKPYKV